MELILNTGDWGQQKQSRRSTTHSLMPLSVQDRIIIWGSALHREKKFQLVESPGLEPRWLGWSHYYIFIFNLSGMICLKNLSLCKFRDVSGVRHFSELAVEIYNLKQYDIFTPDQDKSNSLKQPEKKQYSLKKKRHNI